jgi:hypothetical protein
VLEEREKKKIPFNIKSSSVLFVKNLSQPMSLLMHNYVNHESLYYEGNKCSVKTGESRWVVLF